MKQTFWAQPLKLDPRKTILDLTLEQIDRGTEILSAFKWNATAKKWVSAK